jgi:phosphopantothenoylcysteine decarboxylase/phosphopantothenate--cysteine ligase
VLARADQADVVVMAAAVADYQPAEQAPHKLQKGADGSGIALALTRTPDILADLGARRAAAGSDPRPLLVGFAAETDDVVARAADKRARKRVDLIVANDVSRPDAGFDVDTNEVTIVDAAGAETVPLTSKTRIAAHLLDRVEALLGSRSARRASEVRG